MPDEKLTDTIAQVLYDQYRDVDGILVKSKPLDKGKNWDMWKEMGVRTHQVIEVAKPMLQKPLVDALASIAGNLGRGSFSPSEADNASRPLRVLATETLKKAGYNYYERVGKDNLDGWFTEAEIEAYKEERKS